ncbi:fibroblast growth factor (acidic) intracellular binding protein, isoform CRA_a [Rattus norvegicus]|uniref:Fibroblast growth factor (Acidic) intracellular binding protein, isoform CRA_a n=1 Tax=Rattus norvegicus TaxID=10116 RepID=A6HZ63_RAT|nr:fibroblast growth factor (acidic) intracellular binding protein, isoform CRA_a [Rattus norvegicus]
MQWLCEYAPESWSRREPPQEYCRATPWTTTAPFTCLSVCFTRRRSCCTSSSSRFLPPDRHSSSRGAHHGGGEGGWDVNQFDLYPFCRLKLRLREGLGRTQEIKKSRTKETNSKLPSPSLMDHQ